MPTSNAKEFKGPRTDYNLRPAHYRRALLPIPEYAQPSNVLPSLRNKENANTEYFYDGFPLVQCFLNELHSDVGLIFDFCRGRCRGYSYLSHKVTPREDSMKHTEGIGLN